MDAIVYFYERIGAIFCHQLPQRTLFFEGVPLPFCARDTGIYTGCFISFVVLLMKKRLNADRPPKFAETVVLCILMLPTLADGITSYAGLRPTTNAIRLLTGLLFGMCLPFVLVPAANFKINGNNTRKVLDGDKELMVLTAVNVSVGVILLKTQFVPWLLIASMSVGGFLFFAARLVYTVLARVLYCRKRLLNLLTIGFTVLVLSLMYLFSSFVLQPLKDILLRN